MPLNKSYFEKGLNNIGKNISVQYGEFVNPDLKKYEEDIASMNQSPKYLVLAAFEQHLPWMFEYPAEHNDTWRPVQAYYSTKSGEGPIVAIIYENYKDF